MKRILSVLILCVLVLGVLSGCGAEDTVTATVESVAEITGVGYIGGSNTYAGKVVSGETAEVKKDAKKTILEVLVEEGDMVEKGDVLFTYDMEAMQLSMDKLVIEKESLENAIAAAESDIEELTKQRSKANSSDQLGYTLQIDSRQADKREAEYNLALKEREITAMEKDMETTEITAPIAGRVMKVASTDNNNSGGYGGYVDYGGGDNNNSDAFITIMDVSAYRVEGRINELNRASLVEGTTVTVRSRTDDSTWTGYIAAIDWENPVKDDQNRGMYMGANDEMTGSSKYPFYVELDNADGLILGQHVYIEPSAGSGEPAAMMLPAYYINDPDGSPWVWAASDRDRLEKRAVTLGDYDPCLDEYEILGGLDGSDYIAFPDESLSEGMPVSRFEFGADEYDDMYYEDSYDTGVTYYEYSMPGVVYYEYGW